MTQGKGKVQWNAEFQKSNHKDSLVPGLKRRPGSITYRLSEQSTHSLLWEAVGTAQEDRVCPAKKQNHLSGLGVGNREGVWKGEPCEIWLKQREKSRPLNVLILVSKSFPSFCCYQLVIRKTRNYFWLSMNCIMALLQFCDFQTRNKTLKKKKKFPVPVSQQNVRVSETSKVITWVHI